MSEGEPRTTEIASNNRQVVLFMGLEGVGKTTIARRLATELNKPFISPGGLFRYLAEHDQTEYGDECRAMLAEHRYLDPKMQMAILEQRFRLDDAKDGFVLDAGIRTLEETEGFPSLLERADRVMPVVVFHLRMPEWMSFERLMGQNGRKRDDDTVDSILNRMSKYYDHLGQRAGFIRQQKDWRMVFIDATVPAEEVFRQTYAALAS